MPAAVPNSAPVDIPMANPIIAPYLTLSKQVGPRGRLAGIGMMNDLQRAGSDHQETRVIAWYVGVVGAL